MKTPIPRYSVESQDGDTQGWHPMADTDDLTQAKSLLTSRYRRIFDRATGEVINYGQEESVMTSDHATTDIHKMGTPTINEVKNLDGKIFAMLNDRENQVLDFFRQQGRKYGVAVSIINEADPEDLARTKSQEQADQVMKLANSRVSVKVDETNEYARSIGHHPITAHQSASTLKNLS